MNTNAKKMVLSTLLVALSTIHQVSAGMAKQKVTDATVDAERNEPTVASSQKPDPFPSFSDLLRASLGDLLAPASHTFTEMVTNDVVMEFPYAPSKGVHRIEGKAALTEYLSHAATLIKIDKMSTPVIHRTQNPNIVILEFTGEGHSTETGISYDQTYISVVTLADGYITHYRDYWNPLVVLGALSGNNDAAEPVLKETDNAQ